ncbi:hypothetical protein [Vibrio sp. Isolate24]|uniref:hypothetical protein n=1 Tax=Vibrio sp. Isolate24 TaxID=2908534 RepID=UPI001EFCA2B7|nr:hypothetical protein [Vibrio sp. Isolate24]MCG9678956.1 hypothetical protein [Vibrio sp. Isolate24]
MMSEAVMKIDVEDIDRHLMNECVDADILLLIVLTDIDLTINFSELVLSQAVKYVMAFSGELQH